MKTQHALALFSAALLLWGHPAIALAAPKDKAPAAEVKTCPNGDVHYRMEDIRVVGADPQDATTQNLLATFTDMVQASNRHSLTDILKHYNPKYISGDNLTLAQIKDMIQETWVSYPDICYESHPQEIRIHGDWGTVETSDHSTATAPPDKDILDAPGRMVSDSRSLLFFHRTGNVWEITSDATIWEQATIRYGIAEDVNIVLSTPEQVKAGEFYSATVKADIPEGTFSIATLDNQILTYPHDRPDDKFRTLGGESNELQRVLKANTQNRNELVTATLGLTSVEQKNPDRPSLLVNGIITLVRRVNVVPISSDDLKAAMDKTGQVRISANGKIDLTKPTPAKAPSEEAELDAAPVEDTPQAPVDDE